MKPISYVRLGLKIEPNFGFQDAELKVCTNKVNFSRKIKNEQIKVKSKSNLKKQTGVITIQYLFGVYILLKPLSFHQRVKILNLKKVI